MLFSQIATLVRHTRQSHAMLGAMAVWQNRLVYTDLHGTSLTQCLLDLHASCTHRAFPTRLELLSEDVHDSEQGQMNVTVVECTCDGLSVYVLVQCDDADTRRRLGDTITAELQSWSLNDSKGVLSSDVVAGSECTYDALTGLWQGTCVDPRRAVVMKAYLLGDQLQHDGEDEVVEVLERYVHFTTQYLVTGVV